MRGVQTDAHADAKHCSLFFFFRPNVLLRDNESMITVGC